MNIIIIKLKIKGISMRISSNIKTMIMHMITATEEILEGMVY